VVLGLFDIADLDKIERLAVRHAPPLPTPRWFSVFGLQSEELDADDGKDLGVGLSDPEL
jgi:hypothetical protein